MTDLLLLALVIFLVNLTSRVFYDLVIYPWLYERLGADWSDQNG